MAITNKERSGTKLFRKQLPIQIYGAPVLRNESREVTEISAKIRAFAQQMIDAMTNNNGIGLAAPQVGSNIRLITLAVTEAEPLPDGYNTPGERLLCPYMPIALVNPVITWCSDETDQAEEGCLSIPEIYGTVERASSVVLHARLINGETVHVECGGLLARCLQHEIDHLEGVLFIDHLRRREYQEIESDLNKLEKQTKRKLKKAPNASTTF